MPTETCTWYVFWSRFNCAGSGRSLTRRASCAEVGRVAVCAYLLCMALVFRYRPWQAHNAGTEHVGFSSTMQILLEGRWGGVEASQNERCCLVLQKRSNWCHLEYVLLSLY